MLLSKSLHVTGLSGAASGLVCFENNVTLQGHLMQQKASDACRKGGMAAHLLSVTITKLGSCSLHVL